MKLKLLIVKAPKEDVKVLFLKHFGRLSFFHFPPHLAASDLDDPDDFESNTDSVIQEKDTLSDL